MSELQRIDDHGRELTEQPAVENKTTDTSKEKSWENRAHDIDRKTYELRDTSSPEHFHRLIQELNALSQQADSLRKSASHDIALLNQLDRSVVRAAMRIADAASNRLVSEFNQLKSDLDPSAKPLTVISQGRPESAVMDARTIHAAIKGQIGDLYQEIPEDNVLENTEIVHRPLPLWRRLLRQKEPNINLQKVERDSRALGLAKRQELARKQQEAISHFQETFREFSNIIDAVSQVKTNTSVAYEMSREMSKKAKK